MPTDLCSREWCCYIRVRMTVSGHMLVEKMCPGGMKYLSLLLSYQAPGGAVSTAGSGYTVDKTAH